MVSFRELEINTIINAAGTYTKYSGSITKEEVLDTMKASSKKFVDISELIKKTGNYLADLLKADAAMVTAGAANAMALAAAACIAGTNPANIKKLPDTFGMKNEIIIMRCHRNPYDQALKGAGAKIVEIGNAIETFDWELEAAIGKDSAAIAFFVQSAMFEASLSLERVIKIAHARKVPVIVDAAAELPPLENLTKFTEMGADLVFFSGGKDIRGPQSSGFILGNSQLIEACRLHAYPNHAIGRPMKMDKETIMGLIRAVELYLKEDHKERMNRWNIQTKKIQKSLSSIPGIKVCIGYPSQPLTQPACIPRVYIKFSKKINLTKELMAKKLMDGSPPIAVMVNKSSLIINPHMLKSGEENIVVDKLIEILKNYN